MTSVITRHETPDRRRHQTVIGCCAAMVLLLFAAELAAPHDVTLGTAVLIPILVSSVFLGRRPACGVLLLSAATRLAAAVIGDMSMVLAALEIASYAVATVVTASALDRREAARGFSTPAMARSAPSRMASRISPLDSPMLTSREREILSMTMHGLTAAQVGERLFISRRTVESHLERGCAKLGVRSKRELIALIFDNNQL